MNVNELVNHLDDIEQSILFNWGCRNFEVTIYRLEMLMDLTLNLLLREKIHSLRNKILIVVGRADYLQVYLLIIENLQKGMERKYELVDQIHQMKRKEIL